MKAALSCLRVTALSACVWILASGHHSAAETIDIELTAVHLDFEDSTRDRLGPLQYRGGFAVKSSHDGFGGLSGIVVSNNELTAVTDRGFWFRARLDTDSEGRLVGVRDGSLSPILSSKGEVLSVQRGEHDAEAVERWGGKFAVSFERFHRIGLYDPVEGDQGRPTYIDGLQLARQPPNGGIETLVSLGDGRLLALSEEMEATPESLMGWLIDGNQRATVRYPKSRWKPTDAAFHPDIGILVLERRFSGLGGFSARIRRIDPVSVVPDAMLGGPIVATFETPTITDNFEGLAISQDGPGRITVWILSDDNFNFLQRTLLLAFRWIGD